MVYQRNIRLSLIRSKAKIRHHLLLRSMRNFLIKKANSKQSLFLLQLLQSLQTTQTIKVPPTITATTIKLVVGDIVVNNLTSSSPHATPTLHSVRLRLNPVVTKESVRSVVSLDTVPVIVHNSKELSQSTGISSNRCLRLPLGNHVPMLLKRPTTIRIAGSLTAVQHIT